MRRNEPYLSTLSVDVGVCKEERKRGLRCWAAIAHQSGAANRFGGLITEALPAFCILSRVVSSSFAVPSASPAVMTI